MTLDEDKSTEICWHCKEYKPINQFKTSEGEHICKSCFDEYDELCKKLNVTFIEEERGQGHYATWHNTYIDHTDVYAVIDNKKVFIRGYVPKKYLAAHNLAEMERGDIFNMKLQFLKNGLKFFTFHCGKQLTPIEFLKWIKESDDNFGDAYNNEVKYLKSFDIYDFHGNLEKMSCAFHFRIYDKNYLKEFLEALKDPYFKNMKVVGVKKTLEVKV